MKVALGLHCGGRKGRKEMKNIDGGADKAVGGKEKTKQGTVRIWALPGGRKEVVLWRR